MRSLAASVLVLLLAASCGRPADNGQRPDADLGDSWAAAQAAGSASIRVLYVPAEGFAYRTNDGELTGVTVDIMREFARWVHAQHGVTISPLFVEEPDWQTFYGRVSDASGGVFGLGNVTITQDRRRELNFSPAYLTNVAVLITHDSVPALRHMEDAGRELAGLTPLAFRGTLHETRLRALRDEHMPSAELATAQSNREIIDRVAAGGHFAYIDAYNYWRALDDGVPLRRHDVADDPAEEFGIIMPLDNDWAPVLEAFFRHDGGYRETAQYRLLLEHHLGEPLTDALETARRAAGDGV
ncbi:hypothetical protein BH23GEM9_BH23GEM9_17230 [soil metagenome]